MSGEPPGDGTEDNRRLPVYVLADTSGSMAGGPIAALKEGMRDLVSVISEDPLLRDESEVSLLSFDDEARVESPLSPPSELDLSELETAPEAETSLGAGLRLLRERLANEIDRPSRGTLGDWRPVVLLYHDGYPTDEWEEALEGFQSSERGGSARCHAIGTGPEINADVLESLSTDGRWLRLSESRSETLRALLKLEPQPLEEE